MGKLIGREPVEEIEYPESDGKPMAETDVHRKAMIELIERLTHRYAGRNDVYVTGNLLVYFVEGKPAFCLAPDCFVAFGVPPGDRRTFKTWEEGVFPAVAFEVTSAKTEAEDTGVKFTTYQDVWKVRELFYFDPTGDYLSPPVAGYRLHRGKLKQLRPRDGRLFSTELGISLEAEGRRLILRDADSGEEIERPGEALVRTERAARDASNARLAALEAELAEVRKRLASLSPPGN